MQPHAGGKWETLNQLVLKHTCTVPLKIVNFERPKSYFYAK